MKSDILNNAYSEMTVKDQKKFREWVKGIQNGVGRIVFPDG